MIDKIIFVLSTAAELFALGHQLLGDRLGSADTNFGRGVKRSEVRGLVPNW